MCKKKYSRRSFLGTASCAAIGSTTFFSTFFNLQSMSAASLQNARYLNAGEDYRALVCIMLGGGNDSFNMIVPSNTQDYNDYANTRSNLALSKNSLLPLNANSFNEKNLGLHPSMPELKTLFDSGKVAVINNVGTLVEPITKSQYLNGARLPFGLFSHSDQDQQWQTSVPQTKSATGWGGRLADLVEAANNEGKISMNISLSGKNVFQLGKEASEYSILPTGKGAIGIKGYGGDMTFNQIKTQAINSLMEQQYQDIFKQTYSSVVTASQNTNELFSTTVGNSNIATSFSTNQFSQSLRMIARTIKVRKELGLKRQTFFVRFDGWDHHDEVLNNQSQMLSVLSKGMSEFQAALGELNLEDNVTTFTISDFARTLTSNGNGTDHAWGGNVLVMGGKVKGKDIYGSYPSIKLGTELEIGEGVLIPQISTDEYFAELALWYGVGKTDLVTLFPNIGNFYNTMSAQAPIGFMNLS
ncbi:MAG: DUF1501 domain-containing protein [Bacteroidia bacterium]|nr:DUF1501 domain-containing protein [Bacteroidia bacterium]